MSTFTTKPSPQFKQEVFVYKSGSFWKIGRGSIEDGRFVDIETGYNNLYTLKEQAIIDAKAYANYWGDKFVELKGE